MMRAARVVVASLLGAWLLWRAPVAAAYGDLALAMPVLVAVAALAAVFVGRARPAWRLPSAVAGDAVLVPVQWSAQGRARTTLFTLDAAGGALRGHRTLEGCVNHRAIACAGDVLCWVAGERDLRFEALG